MTCCEPSWWECLDGRPGPDGLRFISAVIDEFEAKPDEYREMNPPNGWGDMDRLLVVFREMRNARN